MRYMQWMERARKVAEGTKFYPVIAGGALRDTLLGAPVKDIDVFMIPACGVEVEPWEAVDVCDNAGLEIDFMSEYEEDEIKKELGIIVTAHSYVLEKTGFKGLGMPHHERTVFNYIFMNKQMNICDLMETFDFGICKIAMTTDGTIFAHPDFWQDALNKTLTLLQHRGEERKAIRTDRMMGKYPRYDLVDKTKAVYYL